MIVQLIIGMEKKVGLIRAYFVYSFYNVKKDEKIHLKNGSPLLVKRCCHTKKDIENRKNDLILIMTPEKQDKTLELSKHWSVDSTPARNEVIMKRTYPVKSVKCDKICSNY